MEKTLRRLTACLLLVLLPFRPVEGQQTASLQAAPTHNAAAGNALVSEVLARLESHSTIAAKVLVRGSLGGRQFVCDDEKFPGTYLQSWNQNRDKLSVRWEVQGHVGGTPVSLLQISNGDRLWTDQHLPLGRRVTDVDLRAVRRQVNRLSKAAPSLPAGAAGVLPMQTELSAEQGGLPALIAGLEQSFYFSQPVSLELSGKPVLGTIGHWRPEALALVNPPQAESEGEQPQPAQPQPEPPLPDHLPASVLLVVAQADYFPYIVEFRRDEGSTPDRNSHSSEMHSSEMRFQLRTDPLMLLRLYEIEFDKLIDAGVFRYQMGDVDSRDLTAQRIEKLRRTQQARLAAMQNGRR